MSRLCVLKAFMLPIDIFPKVLLLFPGLTLIFLSKERRRTLALYMLARLAQCLYNSLKQRGLFHFWGSDWAYGDALLFALSSAQVCFCMPCPDLPALTCLPCPDLPALPCPDLAGQLPVLHNSVYSTARPNCPARHNLFSLSCADVQHWCRDQQMNAGKRLAAMVSTSSRVHLPDCSAGKNPAPSG